MKPAPFEYFAPTSLDEAVGLLDQYGEDAKILAGGQSLVPMMNFRLVRTACLIDINGLSELAYIEEADGGLRVGALTRQRDLERSELVRGRNGLLIEGVRLIGHPAIRTRGTVGGSIVHADPTAELPAILAALDGEVRVTGPSGSRALGWQDFFLMYFTTALDPTEICVEVVFPSLSSGAGWAYQEFTHRHGDFALVGVAAVLEVDSSGGCSMARIAVAGVGPTPERAGGAEAFLLGQRLDRDVFQHAARLVSEEIEPEADLHASEDYRRHLAATMAVRALERAAERLKGRGDDHA